MSMVTTMTAMAQLAVTMMEEGRGS